MECKMMNQFNQPIGPSIEAGISFKYPDVTLLEGRTCRLERLNLNKHANGLYEVFGPTAPLENWTYMGIDPFQDRDSFDAYFKNIEERLKSCFFAIINNENNEVVGSIALMRIDPDNGSVEIGYVVYSPKLQKTVMATEVVYLLARYVFEDLSYRRLEWKCDTLNEPSYRAALRYGFSYEGTFRNALIYKNRSRDTAWFSIIDSEWPSKKTRFVRWLDDSNFDSEGNQRRSLRDF